MTAWGNACFTCIKKYFDFKGRASHSEFWYYILMQFTLNVFFLSLIPFCLPNDEAASIMIFLMMLINIFFGIPGLAVRVRRLHDTGRSGNWLWLLYGPLLFACLIYLISAGYPYMRGYNVLNYLKYYDVPKYLKLILAFILAFSLAAAVVLIRFYYQESYPAENVYGPVPQKIESTEKNKYSFTEEKTSSINADELVKLKKLLDDGIITQEDFDAKKKELLGL